MNEWVQRIEKHALFGDLESLRAAIQSATPLAEAANTTAIEALDRVSRVAEHLGSALSLVDPVLVLPAWLEPLRQGVSQCTACLNNFINDKNAAHLNTANTHADNVLANSAILWQASSPRAEGDVRKAISDFSAHCSALTKNLEQEVEGTKAAATTVRTRLDEFGQEITSQKQRIDAAITQFTQTFNDAETARTAEFSRLKEEVSSEFDHKRTVWEAEVATAVMNAGKRLDTMYAKGEEGFKTRIDNLDAEGKELLAKLNAQKDEAERLVGIISMTGMVGGYQKVADDERKAFITWRRITLVSMVVLTGFAVYAFIHATSPDFQAGAFANRIFVTVTLAILAGYCAFQADRHRRAEMVNRRMELELASFDPFLATLEDGERNALKKQIADRIFGQFGTDKSNHDGASPANLIDVVKQLIGKLPTPTK